MAKTIEIFEREDMKAHVKEVGAYLEKRLDELAESFDMVLERRGRGLIQGLRLDRPVGGTINQALEEGLLIISARSDVIRLVPPLVIGKEHVDEMIGVLRKVLGDGSEINADSRN